MSATFFDDMLHTGAHALSGLLLSLLVTVALTTFATLLPIIRRPVEVFGVATKVSPAIAYAPLLLVLIGIGSGVKILTAALFCFYPLVTSVIQKFDDFPARLDWIGFTYHAPVWRRVRTYGWAYLLDSLCTGLVTAAPLAVIGSIVADYVMAGTRPGGIGQGVMRASNYSDTSQLLWYALASTVLGIIGWGAAVLARRLIRRRLHLRHG